jgi:hypothetical protein
MKHCQFLAQWTPRLRTHEQANVPAPSNSTQLLVESMSTVWNQAWASAIPQEVSGYSTMDGHAVAQLERAASISGSVQLQASALTIDSTMHFKLSITLSTSSTKVTSQRGKTCKPVVLQYIIVGYVDAFLVDVCAFFTGGCTNPEDCG